MEEYLADVHNADIDAVRKIVGHSARILDYVYRQIGITSGSHVPDFTKRLIFQDMAIKLAEDPNISKKGGNLIELITTSMENHLNLDCHTLVEEGRSKINLEDGSQSRIHPNNIQALRERKRLDQIPPF